MLKKINRLSRKKDFETVNKQGKVIYSPILMIKFCANDLAISRFGIIVSNKVSKKATLRNLIKRQLREILRLSLAEIKKGIDLVIIVSPKIINQQGKVINYAEIEKSLKAALQKAKLL